MMKNMKNDELLMENVVGWVWLLQVECGLGSREGDFEVDNEVLGCQKSRPLDAPFGGGGAVNIAYQNYNWTMNSCSPASFLSPGTVSRSREPDELVAWLITG